MMSSDNSVRIVESKAVGEPTTCLIGFPDVGLVGPIAVDHVISHLDMEECGHIESDVIPPVVVIHKGLPNSPIRIFRKNDLIAVTSEIPISAEGIPVIAGALMDWLESKEVDLLISISGIAVQNRLEIERPDVYGVGSQEDLKQTLGESGVQIFEEGFVVGTYAYLLRESKSRGMQNILLMSQSHLQYPDPEAAVSAIGALEKLLRIDIDTNELEEQSEQIRLMTRELMKRTSQAMRQMGKAQELELPAMYR